MDDKRNVSFLLEVFVQPSVSSVFKMCNINSTVSKVFEKYIYIIQVKTADIGINGYGLWFDPSILERCY